MVADDATPPGPLPEPAAEAVLEPLPTPAGPEPLPWGKGLGLLVASVAGSALVVPYSMTLLRQAKPAAGSPGIPEAFLPLVMAVEVIVEAGLAAFFILLGLSFGPRAGLGTPLLVGGDGTPEGRVSRRNALALAVGLGVLLGVMIIVGGRGLEGSMPAAAQDIKTPPPWEGFLASLGAGIREEVWLRFGFMTALAGAGAWLTRSRPAGPVVIWSANVLAALLFGAMHLPQAAQLIGLNAPLVAYVFVANGVPGVIWGWLYWRKGLVAAMASHFVADVVTKTVYPLLGGG